MNSLDKVNLVFSGIFILESILKIFALGFTQYFSASWNIFDFVFVAFSVIDIFMDALGSAFFKFLRIGPKLAQVMRVIRITRLFRLVKKLKKLKLFIDTIVIILPSLLNVLALSFLMFFVYAVLGVFLFKNIV